MKRIVMSIIFIMAVCSFSYAAESENTPWQVTANIRGGSAIYKEKATNLKSTFKTIYPELVLGALKRFENGWEVMGNFGFGYSLSDTETWYVSSNKYQTNDLDFYRLNAKGAIGKVFSFGKEQDLELIPFVGYGFRMINFQRSNFNVLNTVTSRDIVTEKYYIQHGDAGLKIEKKFGEKFSIMAQSTYGYVFYNLADNNTLGRVNGDGKYIAEGEVNLIYALNKSWQLVLGGFGEFQDLKGGTKDNIIWPDNKMYIYGGQVGAKYRF